MVGIVIYLIIGLALCFLEDDPQHETEEEENFYMFILIAMVFLWPLYLLYRWVVKQNGKKADL
ncbi:hypothetical protein [Halobacillus ihumii]|uniref:hypothetical protein n=1 Tax=Halobacillus ihumii TaxID=2686092 RepID=UPI0013D1AF70|nr:hypothetical protein [Halobacillus ihumii]